MEVEKGRWDSSESDRNNCDTSDNVCRDVPNRRYCFIGNVIMRLIIH